MRAVIITGDRYAGPGWTPLVRDILEELQPSVLIHGACGVDADSHFTAANMKGIDYIAHFVAPRGSGVIPMPAPFKREGLRGGPLRNTAMLKVLQQLAFVGYSIEVHAFHDDLNTSKGTKDMVKQARAAGVPVFIHRSDEGATS